MFVAFDIETTGSDSERDFILEVGAVSLRQGIDGVFREGRGFCAQVRCPEAYVAAIEVPVVREMHQRLVNAPNLERSAGWSAPPPPILGFSSAHELDVLLADEFASQGANAIDRKVVLIERSPFDYVFIKRQCPLTARLLHHRIIDLSTLRAMAQMSQPDAFEVWNNTLGVDLDPNKHSALADALSNVREFEAYRRLFRCDIDFGFGPRSGE